ncbi:hypothetical protein [Carnobacterium jeotgali]|uniref:hypothetical protein n=1 Tax=Carnobacterium jeotgali TaxID=545534 RepID=UPI00049365C3|nr:hypothetical protein [Carnobacterium jeotgali]
MPSENFWRTVAIAFQTVKLENDKKKAIERVKDDGREAEKKAVNWKDEYPFLDSVSARLFGKSTSTLIHIFGCRSHPGMLILISLTHGGEKLAWPTSVRDWVVKGVQGPHPGLDETIRFRRGQMMELAENIDNRYGGIEGVPAIEAYLLENAIPDHSSDWTVHLASLSNN